MQMLRARRGLLALALAIPLVTPLGCGGDGSTSPFNADLASLAISANVAGTTVSTLVVTVTAADIATPIVQNIEAANDFATGTIKMPPGDARTIKVQAFAGNGDVTHEGQKTVDVRPGNNPPLSIPMVSRGGHVPITVQFGEVSIAVSPAGATIAVGGTQQLVATILAPNGDPITEVPVWATTDPSVASVSASGVVTGKRVGAADIVVSYAGIAAKVVISVQAGETAPTAHAGSDQWVTMGGQATLDGSASTGVAGGLSYLWTQVSGPDVTGGTGTLAGVAPHFTAPASVRTIAFDLVVSDANGASTADRVNVTVLEPGVAMFVSSTGSDITGNGSRATPFATIQRAITEAAAGVAAGGTSGAVYVGEGTFGGFNLASAVSVYGGFAPATWTRSTTLDGTSVAGGTSAIVGSGVTNLALDGLSIRSTDASTAGTSSYGVRLASSTGVRLSNLHIFAGRGASGAAGVNGASGMTGGAGNQGQAGASASSAGGGGGGGGMGTLAGGSGGVGGYDNGSGQPGAAGAGGTPGGAPGSSSGACYTVSARGGNGAPGAFGAAGSSGAGATSFGVLGATGYVGTDGGNGAAGAPGAGGGGGGGGGGGASGFLCSADRGGGGGGGGGGGAGGQGGSGGRAGGGSFGVYLHNSTLTLVDQVEITTAAGGAGGAGGSAGVGGNGGAGAPGGPGADDSGAGGTGGPGGRGGNGGGGGGGAGGHSIGIVKAGSSTVPAVMSATWFVGAAGLGGAGASGAGAGATGTSAQQYPM